MAERRIPPTKLPDDTLCFHEGQASTYCTQCWTNLHEAQMQETTEAPDSADEERRAAKSSDGTATQDTDGVKVAAMDHSPALAAERIARFASNAYRTLGLPGNASQAAIHEATGAMRRAVKLGVTKTTGWDLLWFAPLNRSEAAIQGALGCLLATPKQRICERLFWFHQGEETLRDFSPASIQWMAAESPPTSPTALHDRALLLLLVAAVIDPEFEDSERWAQAVGKWKSVIDSDEYWRTFAEIETQGNFEPTATADEVQELRRGALMLIAGDLAAIAREATAGQELTLGQRVLRIIQVAQLPEAAMSTLREEVFGPIEDKFEALCTEVVRQCSDRVQRDNESATANRPVCATARRRFDAEVEPRLEAFIQLDGPESDVAVRAREAAATCLLGIALDHTWADEFVTAETLLTRAIAVAAKPATKAHIEESHSTITKGLQQERVWKNLKPIQRAPSLRTVNGFGFRTYGRTDEDSATESYLTTYYFTALFIPIIPLRRYRVIDAGDGRYRFLGRAPLRRFDIYHLGIVCVGVLVFFLANLGSQTGPRTSPRHVDRPSSGRGGNQIEGGGLPAGIGRGSGPQTSASAPAVKPEAGQVQLRRHVQASKANVRQEPKTTAPVVVTLEQGEGVEELGRDGDWTKVRIGPGSGHLLPIVGWIHSSLLTVPSADTAAARDEGPGNQPRGDPNSSLASEIESRRTRVASMEAELRRIQTQAKQEKSQLEIYKQQIERYEREAQLGVNIDRNAYQRVLDQHNALVLKYNGHLAEFNQRYPEYDHLIDETNRLIELLRNSTSQGVVPSAPAAQPGGFAQSSGGDDDSEEVDEDEDEDQEDEDASGSSDNDDDDEDADDADN